MPTELDRPPHRGGKPPWWAGLDGIKVTPGVAALFFLGLVVLSGLAAGVGFVAHHVRASVARAR